ncbi:FecR family protein [Sediminicola luteus]|uniref:Iron dicitrate transport regulator FecR n=1 Tax=Sediminicola luteus TaxID=319238 RepID=A0A2A4G9T7_9FLAO|nr:FecR domain-containing protein [Sediminicola luteus]PCE64746.1 hypothetical protein B7P33_06130 [Sediminicola luteus]
MDIKTHAYLKKYLNGTASERETRVVFEWLSESEENKSLFIKLKKDAVLTGSLGADKKAAWQTISNRTAVIPKKNRYQEYLKYAALLVVALIGGLAYWMNSASVDLLPEDSIVLELEDGTKRILEPERSRDITNIHGEIIGRQHQDSLQYAIGGEIVMNTLRIPKAKRFYVKLSDGTAVHLNAGSVLTYPTAFPANGNREVYIQGEGYFEVAKDKSRPFIVRTDRSEARVYGTAFNVNAYAEDGRDEIVLVEGSLGVRQGLDDDEVVLVPNERVVVANETKTVAQVSVKSYVAWLNGALHFENEPLSVILKELERHFNVTIINEYEAIADNRYTGTFDVESLGQILHAFHKHRPFHYKFEPKKNTIRITP